MLIIEGHWDKLFNVKKYIFRFRKSTYCRDYKQIKCKFAFEEYKLVKLHKLKRFRRIIKQLYCIKINKRKIIFHFSG